MNAVAVIFSPPPPPLLLNVVQGLWWLLGRVVSQFRGDRGVGRGQGLMNSLHGNAGCGCRLSGPRCRYTEEEEINWGVEDAAEGEGRERESGGAGRDSEKEASEQGKFWIQCSSSTAPLVTRIPLSRFSMAIIIPSLVSIHSDRRRFRPFIRKENLLVLRANLRAVLFSIFL